MESVADRRQQSLAVVVQLRLCQIRRKDGRCRMFSLAEKAPASCLHVMMLTGAWDQIASKRHTSQVTQMKVRGQKWYVLWLVISRFVIHDHQQISNLSYYALPIKTPVAGPVAQGYAMQCPISYPNAQMCLPCIFAPLQVSLCPSYG